MATGEVGPGQETGMPPSMVPNNEQGQAGYVIQMKDGTTRFVKSLAEEIEARKEENENMN